MLESHTLRSNRALKIGPGGVVSCVLYVTLSCFSLQLSVTWYVRTSGGRGDLDVHHRLVPSLGMVAGGLFFTLRDGISVF